MKSGSHACISISNVFAFVRRQWITQSQDDFPSIIPLISCKESNLELSFAKSRSFYSGIHFFNETVWYIPLEAMSSLP